MAARKEAVDLASWRETSGGQWVQLKTPLIISEATVSGLTLQMQCRKDRPDESFSIQLLAETKTKPYPFARVDWRGTVHQTRHALAGDYNLLNAGRSHFHDPTLHNLFSQPVDFMKENIPVATPLKPEPDDLMTLLEQSGKLLGVVNLKDTEPPPWQSPTSFL